MAEKPRFRRRTVFAKNLGFSLGFRYCNNTNKFVTTCILDYYLLSASDGVFNITLGDRAFPDAAARAWNLLPSFVGDQQSLARL